MSQTAPTAETRGNTLSIIAIVCGVVAVIILPIVFGPVGIVLGIIGKTRNEKLSTIAIVVAVVGMVVGFVLGYLVMQQSGLV
jgi:hypothetical protein